MRRMSHLASSRRRSHRGACTPNAPRPAPVDPTLQRSISEELNVVAAFVDGLVQDTVADCSPRVAVGVRCSAGVPAGVAPSDGSEDELVRMLLVALSVNV